MYVGALPPHPGGSAVSAALILHGLAARGHVVRCVAPVVGADACAPACPGLDVTSFPVPWYETDPRTPPTAGYRDAQQAAACGLLARLLGAARADVCLVGRESFAPDVVDLAHARGVPVVLRLAGGLTGGLADGTYLDAARDALVAEFSKVDVHVSPGRHLAEIARRLGYGEVRVIPNAADLHAFGSAGRDPALVEELALPREAIVVAHASNLKPVKRALDVARSAVLACPRDRRLLYLIVGDGHQRGAMEAEVRAAGLAERFRFVGWRPYAEMPSLLALADLVVMPSASEALARVYVEAQAAGRVLVASDIPAAREVVVDGETGLLFPCGDAAALAETILRIAADPARRAAIGRRARDFVRAHDLPPALDAWESLLAEVAGRPR